MSSARRVFFASYGGGHITMVLPVIAALRRIAPDIDVQLMAMTLGIGRAKAAGEDPITYSDLLNLTDRPVAEHWGKKLLTQNTGADIPSVESIAYLGTNYADLIAQHGEEGAAKRYAAAGRAAFLPVRFMRRVLEELRPDLIVTTNTPRTEEAAQRAASDLGIPGILMTDLFETGKWPIHDRDHRPDATCVLAESVRGRLVAKGFAPETVFVTGNPAFDALFAPEVAEAGAAYKTARGWEGLKLYFYAAGPEATDPSGDPQRFARELTQDLRRWVAANPDTALVVRYHPSDWDQYPTGKIHPRIHFSPPRDEPLQPIIHAADVVIVQCSTVGLEAALLGKTVLSARYSPIAQVGGGILGQGIDTECHSTQDLLEKLSSTLRGTLPPAPTQMSGDGRAAERVATIIRTMLGP